MKLQLPPHLRLKLDSERAHSLELFISAILVVIDASMALLSFYLSNAIAIFSMLYGALFFAFAILYTVKKPAKTPFLKPDSYSLLLHLIFVLMLISYFMIFAADWRAGLGLAISFVISFEAFALFFLFFLPLFFLVFMGVRIMRDEKLSKGTHHIVVFAIVFVLLALYWFVPLNSVFRPDDEELLKLTSINMLLNGTNPYSASIAPQLYQRISSIGATLTTQNTLLGTMDYPVLFFLLFLPFYFLAPPTVHSLPTIYMPAQATVFGFAMLLVFAFTLKKKYILKPPLVLLAFSIYAMTYISSMTAYLMIALLMLAYVKIDSKYAWVILGLCVSIQEQLWLPVVFLLVYLLNNYGLKKFIYNCIGTIALFLLINSYFIAINPQAYVSAVFLPVNQLIMPFNPSPFAFFFMKFYPILLSTYTDIFALTALLLILLFLYWNKKELVMLFSLIPLLFLDHVISSYYAFFLFPFLFTFFVEGRKKTGIIEKELRRRKLLFALFILAILASILIVVYNSHAQYEKSFSIGFEPQSLFVNTTSNTTTENGTISYHNLSNSTVYVYVVTQSGLSIAFEGLINESLISNPQKCAPDDYVCLVALNKIVLPNNASEYPLTLRIAWSNQTREIIRSSVIIYNGKYFYTSDPISNYTAWVSAKSS